LPTLLVEAGVLDGRKPWETRLVRHEAHAQQAGRLVPQQSAGEKFKEAILEDLCADSQKAALADATRRVIIDPAEDRRRRNL
jgi:hypothetical protein